MKGMAAYFCSLRPDLKPFYRAKLDALDALAAGAAGLRAA